MERDGHPRTQWGILKKGLSMLESLLVGFVAMIVAWAQPYAHSHGQKITVAETHCLAEAIYFESRGEGPEGMAAIAYTVLNRTVVRKLQICSVIHQPGQFSYYNPHRHRPIYEAESWIQSAVISLYAQLGVISNPIGNATSYNTTKMASWVKSDGMIFTQKINHHYFYTEKALQHAPPLVLSSSTNGISLAKLQVVQLLNDPQYDALYKTTRIPISPLLLAKLDHSILVQLTVAQSTSLEHHDVMVKPFIIDNSPKFLKPPLLDVLYQHKLERRSHMCASTMPPMRKKYVATHSLSSSRQIS